MERNLNNEDFEEFLKLKADHYKLYPSEKVWKGIHQSLHIRKRWFRIGGSLLFLSTLLFVNYQFNDKNTSPAPPEAVKEAPAKDKLAKGSQPVNGIENVIIATSIARGTRSFKKKEQVTANDHEIQLLNGVQEVSRVNQVPGVRIAETTPAAVDNSYALNDKPQENISIVSSTEERLSLQPNGEEQNDASSIAESEKSIHNRNEINWLQEMAAVKLTSAKRNRFNLQFYFSPTISYRKLTDGEIMKNLSNVPLARNQSGVNNFVDHKPSIGLEVGSNLLFSPSKRLTLKSGLQLNYSRYTIKAYKFYFEKANIALVTSGRVADTMSSYTSLRNFNGYFPEELQNQYLQLSLPIGAELKILGTKRLQFNVAGSVQPSYLLYNDAYLLSSDFINYIKEPSLVRKWNVNTSAEAFVSYYMGGMRWQVGPQFRYQTLSSYNDRYPIKEYLIEYGVKFGVSKTLK